MHTKSDLGRRLVELRQLAIDGGVELLTEEEVLEEVRRRRAGDAELSPMLNFDLIDQSHEILTVTPDALGLIERAGRVCYQSSPPACPHRSPEEITHDFVSSLIRRGHESVLEHASMTIRFITCRSVTHEIVRHRLASYSQESTRYVRYGRPVFVRPVWLKAGPEQEAFIEALKAATEHYHTLLRMGWRPEQAREVLPGATKAEIVVTANFREWRHIFRLRTAKSAHPQIRHLLRGALEDAKARVPVVFGGLPPEDYDVATK